jgi:hypothetical protein
MTLVFIIIDRLRLAAAFLLLFMSVSSLYASENSEIKEKLIGFEKGLNARDINLTMEPFEKGVVWQGLETYPYVKENAMELFNYYKSIRMYRRYLKFSRLEQRISTSADYQVEAETEHGKLVNFNTSFIFLWEKRESSWQIIAINPIVMIPVDSTFEDDLKKVGLGADMQKGKSSHLSPVADTSIRADYDKSNNGVNWGKEYNLVAGWHPGDGEKRVYLKFDLSGIKAKKAGRATLKLYHNRTGGSDDVDIGVHYVSDLWIESSGDHKSTAEINWGHQPSFDLDPAAEFNPGLDANQWIVVDITTLVNRWLSGEPNNGIVIKAEGNLDKMPESQYGFYSREYVRADRRPMLILSGLPDSRSK